MRRAELTRPDFLEWLGGLARGNLPSSMPTQVQTRPSDVTLVWLDGEPDTLPIVAVDPSEMREFLAFTSTYVGSHFPFTAFFRVVPRQMVEVLPRGRRSNRTDVARALVGVTIADAALQIGSTSPRASEIAIQAGLATPSAVVLAAYLLGYDNDLALVALDRWQHVRLELGGGSPKVPIQRLKAFWGTALSILAPEGGSTGPNDPSAVTLLHAAQDGSDLVFEASRRSASALPELEGLSENLRGSREDRVRALDQVSALLRRSTSPPERRELIQGYVAAQVAEGSLNYLALASRFADEQPLSLLWFGLFSGLNRNSDVMTAGECLGRRLFRKFGEKGSSLPPIEADLAYEELMLLSQEGRIPKLRTDQQSVIEVELIPGVCGRFRMSRAARRDEDVGRSQATIEQARKLVAQLQAVLRDSENTSSTNVGPLFDNTRAGPAATPRARTTNRRKK